MQLLYSYSAEPGHCISCGQTQGNKGVVDTEANIDFYGAVYFCLDCAIYIGKLVVPEIVEAVVPEVQPTITKEMLYDELFKFTSSITDLGNFINTAIDNLDTSNTEETGSSEGTAGEPAPIIEPDDKTSSVKKPSRVSSFSID